MPKTTTSIYVCEQCGNEQTKWSGRCPVCGAWNSLSEMKFSKSKAGKDLKLDATSLKKLGEVKDSPIQRIQTGISEFDRVMGGETSTPSTGSGQAGIVLGSVTLISGEPGIGKSTLILQVLSSLSQKNLKCLYLSGEESEQQIKIRADRLGVDSKNIFLLTETNVLFIDKVIAKEKIDLVVIDSIQTVENSNFENSPGSITQIKESASYVIKIAKSKNIPVFIVGHITKEGSIAGPKILEHLVDTVLYFEGERFHTFRILRVIKNRFGAVSEVGIFEMTDKGLLEIKNPSEVFVSKENKVGSVVAVTLEGTRPLLAEVQTLITKTNFGYPKRTASGYDLNRLQILIAVLSRALRMPLGALDVYVSIAGGLKVREPATDLAVCLSIISSFKKVKPKESLAVFGEVGLLGEVRNISKTKERIKEVESLGFKQCIVPHLTDEKSDKLEIIKVSNLEEASQKAFGK